MLSILNALLFLKTASLFQGQTIMGFLEEIGSTLAAKIVGLVLILFALHVIGITLREFGELMVTVFFPETPLLVFIIFMALVAAWAAYQGIEVIARVAQFLLPLTLFGIIISGVLALKVEGVQNLFPLLENGPYPVLRGAITQWAFFGDVVIWFLLLPHLKQRDDYSFMPLSVLIAGVLLVLVLLFIVNGLGAGFAANQSYPFVSLVETVSLARFVERVEGGFLFVWVITNFMKITVFFYAAVFGLGRVLKINNHNHLIIPLMIIVINLAVILFASYGELRNFFRPEFYAVYSILVQIIIPLVVMVIWITKKKGKVK